MRMITWFTALMAVVLLASARATAQETYRPLPIPVPANARVRIEMDAHQEDLLGMVKSFLQGFDGQKLMQMMGAAHGPLPPGSSVAYGSMPAAWARMLSDVRLADLLKDIHHMRIVVFTTDAGGASGAAPATLGGSAPVDLLKLYEEPFRAEGGRRLLWADFEQTHFLMIGFQQPRGFAAIMQAPGMVAAVRADGYFNLEGAGPLIMTAMFMGMRTMAPMGIVSMEMSQPATIDVTPAMPPAAMPQEARPQPAPPVHTQRKSSPSRKPAPQRQ